MMNVNRIFAEYRIQFVFKLLGISMYVELTQLPVKYDEINSQIQLKI